jgi:hypothetical protein
MLTDDTPVLTAMELEAVAALDAALGGASPDAVWNRIHVPVESTDWPERVVRTFGKAADND